MPPAKSRWRNSGVMVSAMMRRDVASVERALEAAADLDAHLAIVLRDEQQRAVIDALTARGLATELPFVDDADRVLLDRFRLRRRHEEHRELRALAGLERRELLLDLRLLACRKRAGEIGDAGLQRRNGLLSARGVLAATPGAPTRMKVRNEVNPLLRRLRLLRTRRRGRGGRPTLRHTLLRLRRHARPEVHLRRGRNLRLVGDGEVRLHLEVEHLRRQVGREAAHGRC